MWTLRRKPIARSCASARDRPRTFIGASMQFSTTERCGNRLKLWNTIPISRRILLLSVIRSVSSTPSTMIRPPSCFSIRLIQRISVDLPEPEGPHRTIFSPVVTLRLTSSKAVKRPNRFTKFSTATMADGRLVSFTAVSSSISVSQGKRPLVNRLSVRSSDRVAPAQGCDALGCSRADGEVDHRNHEIHLDQTAVELRKLRGGAK